MTCDTKSPPGAWREEILKGPATTSQLREIIAELEHCLTIAREDCEVLRDQNSRLINQLTASVASEMEARAHVARLKEETKKLWNTLKTV